MSKPASARYRTTNWKSYNEALKRRGSLLIWLDKDMVLLAPKAVAWGDRRCSPMPRSSSA